MVRTPTPPEKCDLVLHDALIPGDPQSDSIAIAKGTIIARGRFSALSKMVGAGTHLIRLGGRALIPGFIDSHIHFMEAAAVAAAAQVSRARSLGELMLELRQAAGRTPPGNWLRAFGCDEALLAERRGPTRAELDEVTPRNPLRLRHQTLHASWLNSRAIRQLGLEDSAFVPPSGARLWRDSEGRLESLTVGMEQWLSGRLPRVTATALEARAHSFSRELAAAGITAFTDASVSNDLEQIEVFARLLRNGSISQRVSLMLGEDFIDQHRAAVQACAGAGVRLAAIKFRGRPTCTPQTLARVRQARELGAVCAFHATEIEETESALAALESAAGDAAAAPPIQCRIEHGGVIAPEQIERLARLGAWVVTNPGFIYYRGAKYAGEPGLLPYVYRCRSLARTGVRVAGATDAPVTPARPLVAIAAAISRTSVGGEQLAPQEGVGPAQAFGLFTTAGARLAGIAAGTMDPGAAADLIVLSGDPLGLAPAQLAAAAVDLAIVGGRVIYERGRPETVSGTYSF